VCLLAAVACLWPLVARLRQGALLVVNPRLERRATRAETQAKAALGWLNMAEQAAHVGHWSIALPLGTVAWSDEMYRIHGVWREHFHPTLDNVLSAMHPQDAERVSALLNALEEQAGEFETALRLRRPDGEVRHALLRARARRDEAGHITAVLGVMVDVTEPRRTVVLPPFHTGAVDGTEDRVTGLPSRAQFELALGYEFKRAVRARKPLGVVVLEIDQFESYRHRYGPRAAERAQRDIAQALRNKPRRTGDLVAQFGEAQFVVLLPLADDTGAARVAGQLLEVVRALAILDDGRESGALSASCGVAAFVGLDDLYNPAELPRKAARALADARLFGGDRVACFREPVLDERAV
jgi:diguanylate cyclase (GGDEF)-like protein/PAS domain S-box-containing protein